MDGWVDGRMDAYMDAYMDGWIDGWVGGWMDRWMDRWMGCGHSEAVILSVNEYLNNLVHILHSELESIWLIRAR